MRWLPLLGPRSLDIVPQSILVCVAEGLIGDAFMRLPFAAGLRALFPGAYVTWAFRMEVSPSVRAIGPVLLQFCDDLVFDLPLTRSGSSHPVFKRHWDLVVDTQRVMSRSAAMARIPHRRFVSFSGRYWLSDARPAYRRGHSVKTRHYGRQLLDLLDVMGISSRQVFRPPALALPPAVSIWARAPETGAAGRILIAPGAGQRRKCWPLNRIIALARAIEAEGHAVAFVLGPQEQDWLSVLADALPDACFPLRDAPASIVAHEPLATVALAQAADRTFAMDSGVGHMMAAGSRHHTVLFGPTSPETFTPAAASVRTISAAQFHGSSMSDIPIRAVLDAVLDRETQCVAMPDRPFAKAVKA